MNCLKPHKAYIYKVLKFQAYITDYTVHYFVLQNFRNPIKLILKFA